ncbi:hypothetical protein [Saccharopolyspora sp. 5N708]|uniref:hypothetical protein n=1 Tax=Saccharopolyspora sp. 5N708 TaxID=3457424 RepID=UPI003FD1A2F9
MNSNVGLRVSDPSAWPAPRSCGGEGPRHRPAHEFPNLRAVHFVLRGLLGTGGSSDLRVDPLGKAVGEFRRVHQVEVPVELLAQAPTMRSAMQT